MSATLLMLDHVVQNIVVLADDQITVDPVAPPGAPKFLKLLGWARWLCTVAGVGALLFAGAKFGYERWSHGQMESPKMVLAVIIGGIVIGTAPQILYAAMA